MRFRIIIPLVFAACAVAVFAGCSDDSTTPVGKITLNALSSAPDTLTVGGRDYVLQAILWRDFMPITPPDGSPLIAVVRFIALDSERIPAGTELTTLWVVNGFQVWETSDLKPGSSSSDDEIERAAYGGPKWGPRVQVDVVVEVKFLDGSVYRVQVRDQEIGATW